MLRAVKERIANAQLAERQYSAQLKLLLLQKHTPRPLLQKLNEQDWLDTIGENRIQEAEDTNFLEIAQKLFQTIIKTLCWALTIQ